MRSTLALFAILGLAVSSVQAQDDPVKARLEKSPRHHEWVTVKNGSRAVKCFLVFPEVKDKALAVLVIHENKGLQTFEKGVADQLAEAGYIAIVPDLLSGMGPGGGDTDSFKSTGDATKAIYALKERPAQVSGDLNAVANYVEKLPACNGRLAVCGFCWGGGQCWTYANGRKDLRAAFVFYGTGPETKDAVENIRCPVYGFYGGMDARVGATVPKSFAVMKEAGQRLETYTYEGAGHGFVRAGELPGASAANQRARTDAWQRWKELLKGL
jgi:carboxymethylenebutenolidase